MTEPTDRAERAFRDAFTARGGEAPQEPLEVSTDSRRRTWWVAGAAAAVVVAAVAVPVAILSGADGPDRAVPAERSTSANQVLAPGNRWLGYLDQEFQVPADWPLDTSPARPDCAYLSGEEWRGPDQPYVEIGFGWSLAVDIGCFPPDLPADLPEEFGELPFDLWVSHVTLGDPRADTPEGSWKYRGWTLTRTTVRDVQVTVLESPDDAGLAEDVLASARTVDMDVNGCPTSSPAQEAEFQVPTGPPVPADDWRGVVVLCQYSRGLVSHSGLVGSRQLGGAAARSLVAAINDAPLGGGPDRPQNCIHDEYGETAVLLRFLPADGFDPEAGYPEAYVYYDHCFGNGVFDSSGSRQLTQANCEPLFTDPPVTLWVAQSNVGELCNPYRG